MIADVFHFPATRSTQSVGHCSFTYTIIVSILFMIASSFSAEANTKNAKIQLDAEYENEIDAILAQLTLEEKIAMTHASAIFSSMGVERLGIPELQYADGPTGIREETQRDSWASAGLTSDSAMFMPTGTALAATWNVDLALKYGTVLGEQARARGKDVLLATAINIIRTPVCGRNFEYFSEDPFLNARITVGYVRGVQSRDVAACIKHYAVNNQENNRWRIDVLMDERALREIYLPAYKAAVQEGGALAVMGAYNKFRGSYCCENRYLLHDILKGEWGFPGIVISDWGATHSTIESALNGLDVEMGSRGGYDNYYLGSALLKAVQNGEVDTSIVDDKVRRVLRVMFACKMMDENRHQGAFNTPEQSRIAYQVASESIVLLKNEGLLPLKMENIHSIAVIGDNATEKFASGGFGAGVKAKYEITSLQGLQKKLGDSVTLKVAQGYAKHYIQEEGQRRWTRRRPDNRPDSTLIEEAVEAAKEADIAIIFAGSNRLVESEGFDRPDLMLPFGQVELIKAVAAANPKTIVAIAAGAPFDLSEIEPVVSALVWSWFNGSEGGNALADVLFGNVNPSGKLPFTIPVSLDDSPAHALKSYPGNDVQTTYSEGVLVGYRWFDTKEIEPLYCFGYGQSYTQFGYSSLKLDKTSYKMSDKIEVSFILKNSGHSAGAETVQLYVNDVKASVLRPVKELKGFKKVFLKPGQKEKIQMTLDVQDLAFYDNDLMQWKVEPGQFNLFIGSSSRDIRLSTSFDVKE
jgi:beta-glucosidase